MPRTPPMLLQCSKLHPTIHPDSLNVSQVYDGDKGLDPRAGAPVFTGPVIGPRLFSGVYLGGIGLYFWVLVGCEGIVDYFLVSNVWQLVASKNFGECLGLLIRGPF